MLWWRLIRRPGKTRLGLCSYYYSLPLTDRSLSKTMYISPSYRSWPPPCRVNLWALSRIVGLA